MSKTMQAARVLADGRIETREQPVPTPRRNQVLIRVHCSPVNPADRMQVAGRYVQNRTPPFTPGVVGVGTVIDASRAGLMGRFIAGKRVVFSPGPQLDGAWAQFALAPVGYCLPLAKTLSDTDGVNLLANATTAIGLLRRARQARAAAVVMTAAAGEIGRLLNIAARKDAVPVINVVQREAQAAMLRREGVEHVLLSQTGDFREQLALLAGRLGATMAFDAVGGELTQELLAALPDGSEIVALGRLSGQDMSFNGLDALIGRHMRLSGFDVNQWLASQSRLAILSIARQAARLLHGQGTRVQHRVSLPELAARFEELGSDQSAGKTIVFPNG
jgi:NADPH:quinone reductase-like Zn-dependent oxidoreductase